MIAGDGTATRSTAPWPIPSAKLTPPAPRRPAVPRRRLEAVLGEAMARRLTLVSAPAGSGKTTLVSAWAAGLSRRGRLVAWVTLGDDDNDPARFWQDVVLSLQAAGVASMDPLFDLVRSPTALSSRAIVTALEAALAPVGDAVTLVVDDYQVVGAPSIHDGLALLIERLWPVLRLVIVTRTDPPLPLARWRANDQLAEVRTADLRFTLEEAGDFLRDVMGIALSADDVISLHDRTEGWIAGLQLAALALRGQASCHQVLRTFGGDHRHVVDYLTEEVLLQQPPDVQAFLLRTAILHRLCGPLCDALTGRNDGQTMLEQVERANLFLVPLDEARHWYRYHSLFAGVLRQRLGRTAPDRTPLLHRSAAAWYEQQGEPAEAIEHALAAADTDTAARLMEGLARTLLMQGEATTILRRLGALPEEMRRQRPELGLVYAWALAHSGQLDAVEPWLRAVEHTWLRPRSAPVASAVAATNGAAQHGAAMLPPARTEPADGGAAVTMDALAGEVAAVRARVAAMRGEVPATIEQSQRALAQLPAGRTFLRSDLALNLGFAQETTGDFAAAHQTFVEAERIARSSGNVRAALLATRYLARSEVQRGRLHRARELYVEALRRCEQADGRRLPAAGMACVGLGELSYEWDDLEGATRYLHDGIALGAAGGEIKVLLAGYAARIRLLQARGEAAAARAALREGERRVSGTPLGTTRAWLVLMQGDVATAIRWAGEHGPAEDANLSRAEECRLLARVRLRQGRADEAIALLGQLLIAAEAAGWTGSSIRTLALQAVALHAAGRTSQARQTLERALALAEPEGYVRVFLDEGAPMAQLLAQCRPARRSSSVLASAFRRSLAGSGWEARGDGTEGPSRDALSERERTALRLLAAGLSNRDMAREMVVTLNTVKTHVKSVYGKLGVHRRAQAAARARQLGLL